MLMQLVLRSLPRVGVAVQSCRIPVSSRVHSTVAYEAEYSSRVMH